MRKMETGEDWRKASDAEGWQEAGSVRGLRTAGNLRGWRKARVVRRLWAAAFSGILTCLLAGCSLALEETGVQGEEADRLAGIFVTERYVDGGAAELSVDWKGEVSVKENPQKIMGTLVMDEHGPADVVFEGIEGYGIYEIRMDGEFPEAVCSYGIVDDIFSDVSWEMGDVNLSIEAAIYVEPGKNGAFYFNPVYQTPQGQVYLLPGTGLTCGEMTEGGASSHTLSAVRKVTENGQETAEGSSVKVNILCAERPESYSLLFMDDDNRVAAVMTGEELSGLWDAGQWEVTVPAGTAYLILEQEKRSGDVTRLLAGRGEERLEFLWGAGGGYLAKGQMTLRWE